MWLRESRIKTVDRGLLGKSRGLDERRRHMHDSHVCGSRVWLSNVTGAVVYALGQRRPFKIHKFSRKWISINIFKGKEKKRVWRAVRWCLLILFSPTAALEKVELWNDKPLKKVNEHTWTVSTTAPLNHAYGFEKGRIWWILSVGWRKAERTGR